MCCHRSHVFSSFKQSAFSCLYRGPTCSRFFIYFSFVAAPSPNTHAVQVPSFTLIRSRRTRESISLSLPVRHSWYLSASSIIFAFADWRNLENIWIYPVEVKAQNLRVSHFQNSRYLLAPLHIFGWSTSEKVPGHITIIRFPHSTFDIFIQEQRRNKPNDWKNRRHPSSFSGKTPGRRLICISIAVVLHKCPLRFYSRGGVSGWSGGSIKYVHRKEAARSLLRGFQAGSSNLQIKVPRWRINRHATPSKVFAQLVNVRTQVLGKELVIIPWGYLLVRNAGQGRGEESILREPSQPRASIEDPGLPRAEGWSHRNPIVFAVPRPLVTPDGNGSTPALSFLDVIHNFVAEKELLSSLAIISTRIQ